MDGRAGELKRESLTTSLLPKSAVCLARRNERRRRRRGATTGAASSWCSGRAAAAAPRRRAPARAPRRVRAPGVRRAGLRRPDGAAPRPARPRHPPRRAPRADGRGLGDGRVFDDLDTAGRGSPRAPPCASPSASRSASPALLVVYVATRRASSGAPPAAAVRRRPDRPPTRRGAPAAARARRARRRPSPSELGALAGAVDRERFDLRAAAAAAAARAARPRRSPRRRRGCRPLALPAPRRTAEGEGARDARWICDPWRLALRVFDRRVDAPTARAWRGAPDDRGSTHNAARLPGAAGTAWSSRAPPPRLQLSTLGLFDERAREMALFTAPLARRRSSRRTSRAAAARRGRPLVASPLEALQRRYSNARATRSGGGGGAGGAAPSKGGGGLKRFSDAPCN